MIVIKSKEIFLTLIVLFCISGNIQAQLLEKYQLFSDSFNNVTDDSWIAKKGDWSIRGEKYYQNNLKGGALSVLKSENWDDIIVDFKVNLLKGEKVKFYFRYTAKTHYVLELHKDKNKSVLKLVKNGKETRLSDIDFGMDSDFHYVMIQTIDNRLNVWIDSRNYLDLTLNDTPKGSIAIGTHNAEAWFDNILAYKAKMN